MSRWDLPRVGRDSPPSRQFAQGANKGDKNRKTRLREIGKSLGQKGRGEKISEKRV